MVFLSQGKISAVSPRSTVQVLLRISVASYLQESKMFAASHKANALRHTIQLVISAFAGRRLLG